MIDTAVMDLSRRIATLERELERRNIEVHGAPILRLNYVSAADIWNGTVVGVATNDIIANQSFTVTSSTSLVQIAVIGSMEVQYTAVARVAVVDMIIDNTTVVRFGAAISQAANQFINPFDSASPMIFTGLAAGSHTVKVRLTTDFAGTTLYLLAATAPQYYWLRMLVLELPT